MQNQALGMVVTRGDDTGGFGDMLVSLSGDQNRQMKAQIANHHLYHQLLSAHVGCLRVATPIDQLPLIDAQLSQSHNLLLPYMANHHQPTGHEERHELDNIMVRLVVFVNVHYLVFFC